MVIHEWGGGEPPQLPNTSAHGHPISARWSALPAALIPGSLEEACSWARRLFLLGGGGGGEPLETRLSHLDRETAEADS